MALLVLARLPLEAVAMIGAWGTALVATVDEDADAPAEAGRGRGHPGDRGSARRLELPGGRTITYVGLYGFLAYLAFMIRPAWLRGLVTAPLVGLVALVGPSRVYQGHHWFTDVTASYLLGISYLLGLTRLYRAWKAPGTRERP